MALLLSLCGIRPWHTLVNETNYRPIHLSACRERSEKRYEQCSNHELTNPKTAGNNSSCGWVFLEPCTSPKSPTPLLGRLRPERDAFRSCQSGVKEPPG